LLIHHLLTSKQHYELSGVVSFTSNICLIAADALLTMCCRWWWRGCDFGSLWWW